MKTLEQLDHYVGTQTTSLERNYIAMVYLEELRKKINKKNNSETTPNVIDVLENEINQLSNIIEFEISEANN